MTPEELIAEKKRQVGAKCHHARVRRKWSLYRAEQASGLQGIQITAIETGSRDYTFSSLLRYAHALGIDLEVV